MCTEHYNLKQYSLSAQIYYIRLLHILSYLISYMYVHVVTLCSAPLHSASAMTINKTEIVTDLSGYSFHHHSSYRNDSAPLRIVERALWMIQAGQRTNLVLGHCRLVWRLKKYTQKQ